MRKNKFGKILIIILVILIAILGFKLYKMQDGVKETASDIETTPTPTLEEKEEKTSMSLIMCGDYLIHSSVYKDAARYQGGSGYDFKPMLTYIKEKVKGFDLAYYNQETILGGKELGVSDYPNFNSPYEAGDAMINAGFNLVSLATNHTMDSGEKAVLNSRNYWNKQEGVFAVRKL